MSTLEEMAARAQKRSASTQMAFEGAEAEVFNIPLGGSSRDVRPRTTVMDEEEQPQVDTSQAENSSSGPSVAPRIPVQWRAEWLWQVAGVQRQWQKLWWLAPHGALAKSEWEIRMSRGGLPETKRSEKVQKHWLNFIVPSRPSHPKSSVAFSRKSATCTDCGHVCE